MVPERHHAKHVRDLVTPEAPYGIACGLLMRWKTLDPLSSPVMQSSSL
jgi:hypothetical protein